MFFELTDDQLAFQDATRKLLDTECDSRRLAQAFDGTGFDEALWRELGALGALGLLVSDEHGGSGLQLLDAAVIAEVLGHAGCPGPFLGHMLATLALAQGGSAAQQARWLPRLASGEAIGTVAFCDGAGAWQPEQWTLVLGDRLSGRKCHVLQADRAALFIVGTDQGLALVDADQPGVRIDPVEGSDRGRRLFDVSLEGVACEPLSGGLPLAARVRDAALVLLAADAFGGASRCLEMAVEYAKTREQFDRPIGAFQALKHQLANMALEIEPARSLYWYAAYAQDHVPGEAPRCAAMAKAHLTDVFAQAARDAVEAHGGIGYTWEYPLHMWVKRSLFDRAYLGIPAVHRHRAAELAGW